MIEPPCTERYARWCKRSVGELIAYLLLDYEKTDVTMRSMDETEIRRYIATGEPMDKAGAYGIQGKCAIYIDKIHGDYNNVVGLPVAAIYRELKTLGIDLYLW